MSDAPTDAIILGAGPSGLMLAASLLNRGHRVRVFDPSSEPQTEGLDLIVPNGMRALQAMGLLGVLGLDARHEEHLVGTRIRRWQCFNAAGSQTCEVNRPGFAVSMQRRHLMKLLLDKVVTVVHWEMQPVRVAQQHDADSGTTSVVVDFANGAAAVGDWLAGCDGCHSFVRSQLLLADVRHRGSVLPDVAPIAEPVRLPAHILTGVVRARLEDTSGEADEIRDWAGDEGDSIAIFERPHLSIWVERIGVSRLHWTAVVSHEFQRLHTNFPVVDDKQEGGQWSATNRCRFAAVLMSKFEHPLMAAMRKYMLAAAEKCGESLASHKGNKIDTRRVRSTELSWASVPEMKAVYDMEHWRGGLWGSGHVVLLGNAAHVTTPVTQQGLNLAMEDCAVLTLLLDIQQAHNEKHGLAVTHNLQRVFVLLAKARSERVREVTQNARQVYASNFESTLAGRLWRDVLWAFTSADATFAEQIRLSDFDCRAGLIRLFQHRLQREQRIA